MLDHFEQRIVEDVEKFGCHLVMVAQHEEGPGFVYTIGLLKTYGHPEIVIFGLSSAVMGTVLNDIARQIGEGRDFSEEGLFEDVFQKYACKMIPVGASHHTEYLGYAMWFQRYCGVPGTLDVMQCLWVDKSGLFPDEAGCDSGILKLQPVLR